MRRIVCGLFCVLALEAGAQTDFSAMTPPEQQAFEAELRDFLWAEPDLLADAMAAPDYATAPYQDEARADMALIASLSDQILQGADIAIFTQPDCADCAIALKELTAISKGSDTTFMKHDMATIDGAALAFKLGMTDAPFYVMPDMILRGHMPEIVLRKYLTR